MVLKEYFRVKNVIVKEKKIVEQLLIIQPIQLCKDTLNPILGDQLSFQ